MTCFGQWNVGGGGHVSIQSLGLEASPVPLTLRVLLPLTESQGGPGHLRHASPPPAAWPGRE